MSQFAFLEPGYSKVHGLAVRAEEAAQSDARAACVYARLALETIVNWLYCYASKISTSSEAK